MRCLFFVAFLLNALLCECLVCECVYIFECFGLCLFSQPFSCTIFNARRNRNAMKSRLTFFIFQLRLDRWNKTRYNFKMNFKPIELNKRSKITEMICVRPSFDLNSNISFCMENPFILCFYTFPKFQSIESINELNKFNMIFRPMMDHQCVWSLHWKVNVFANPAIVMLESHSFK